MQNKQGIYWILCIDEKERHWTWEIKSYSLVESGVTRNVTKGNTRKRREH